MTQISQYYIDGIKEGRSYLKRFNPDIDEMAGIIENLNGTIRIFNADNPVGQLLRGERAFWKAQIKK